MPFIAIFDWSLYSLPSAVPMTNLESDTHSNHPDAGYNASAPSWIGETFTFDGGSSTLVEINDDDANFEDGYVETGGAQTLSADVTINGTTYLAGAAIENEFSMVDASGNEIFVVRIDGVNVGFAYPTGQEPTSGDDFIGVDGRDGDAADSSDGVSGSAEPYAGIVCFTPGVMIDTPDGPRPVESLQVADVVTTLDGGDQPIRWVSHREVIFNDDLENAKPIQIKAGALSSGMPKRDLVVSPQHRILLNDCSGRSKVEVLVAATALTALPKIRKMNGKRSVTYIHFALDRHQLIFAEGVLTESLYIGEAALINTPIEQRSKIDAMFPKLRFNPTRGYGPTARTVLKVQTAKERLKLGSLAYRATSHSLVCV